MWFWHDSDSAGPSSLAASDFLHTLSDRIVWVLMLGSVVAHLGLNARSFAWSCSWLGHRRVPSHVWLYPLSAPEMLSSPNVGWVFENNLSILLHNALISTMIACPDNNVSAGCMLADALWYALAQSWNQMTTCTKEHYARAYNITWALIYTIGRCQRSCEVRKHDNVWAVVHQSMPCHTCTPLTGHLVQHA